MSDGEGPTADWFAERRASFEHTYLLPDATEMQQSGWHGTRQDWRAAREIILDGVTGDGDILDIGCANGLLLESLVAWAGERGLSLVPHGLDFVPQLVELARQRMPDNAENFHVGNAWDWRPDRRYDFVHTLLVYVPTDAQQSYLQRLLDSVVAPGGRLIVSSYGSHDRTMRPLDVDLHLQMLGFRTAGCGNGRLDDGWVATRSAWIDN